METMPIGRAIRLKAEEDPGRPAVTCDGRAITREELDRRTNRLARAFAGMGVRTDDLVTIALPNSIAFYEAAVAAWKLGAVPNPISARLPDAERDALVELADPPVVVGVDDGVYPGRRGAPAGFEPPAELSDDPLPDAIGRSWKAPTSGGSTGRPKIILSGGRGVIQPLTTSAFQIREDGVVLVPGPLYHNAPFMFSSAALFEGNHVVVMPRFDPSETLRLVESYRVEWMWVVPTMMSRIMRLPEAERASRDVSSLRVVWHGAAACPPWVKEAWIEWLGPDRVWELYAGTEAQGVTIIDGNQWLEHRGSVGRPVVGEFTVVDPDTREPVPAGEVGEIYMRLPSGSGPAYRYIGAEAKTLGDGWESIGDMGWMDADGYVYIADRRTDLIVSGGANVYPAEVEAALDEHPLVVTSAVIGLPDDDLGHRVHAIVQTRGEVSERELAEHCAGRIARYKVPRGWEFTDEPLRDDAGKTRRSRLRAERVRS